MFLGAIIPYDGGEHQVKVSAVTIPGPQRALSTLSSGIPRAMLRVNAHDRMSRVHPMYIYLARIEIGRTIGLCNGCDTLLEGI